MVKRDKKAVKFADEAGLEAFVWGHLEALLGLRPLKRQYAIKGECCDLLALGQDQQLVVLELKNGVDRYIVQQLTRYYDHLAEQRPLAETVNYSLPIRLLAIAPEFHAHNWIDQRYNRLTLEFLTFALTQDHDSTTFTLRHLGTETGSTVEVPQTPTALTRQQAETDQVATLLHTYVRVRHAHKLGLPDLVPEASETSYFRASAKGAKAYKIILLYTTVSGTRKQVTVRVPASIKTMDFYSWVYENVPTASGIVTPNGVSYNWGSRDVLEEGESV